MEARPRVVAMVRVRGSGVEISIVDFPTCVQ